MNYKENISKRLSGELNLKEQDEFDAALKTDAALNKAFEECKAIWMATSNVFSNDELVFDAKASFEQFESLTKQNKITSIVPKKSMWNAWRNVAAVGIVLIASVLIINQVTKETFTSDVLVKVDESASVLFAYEDGSHVFINSATSLEVDKNYNKSKRISRLDGEAFFVVKPDKDKAFEVVTSHLKAIVKGTTFLIRTDDHSTTVGVKTGRVEVQIGYQTQTLIAGEQLSFIASSGVIERSILNEEAIKLLTDLTLKFDNVPLKTVFKQLESVRGLLFTTDIPHLLERKVTLDFNNSDNEEVISILQSALQVKIIQNGTIFSIIE
ncbi:MAG: transmembrane sensor [Bacteroidia bacterium]